MSEMINHNDIFMEFKRTPGEEKVAEYRRKVRQLNARCNLLEQTVSELVERVNELERSINHG